MALPDARRGLVFRYEYVWKRQALAGQTVGEKEWPACVVLTVSGAVGDRRVLIVPIAAQPLSGDAPAMNIPQGVKRHLGLDADRPFRIILNEANLDAWPSPDMRPIPGPPGRFEYGLLPQRMVNAIRQTILAVLNVKQLSCINRDDE